MNNLSVLRGHYKQIRKLFFYEQHSNSTNLLLATFQTKFKQDCNGIILYTESNLIEAINI